MMAPPTETVPRDAFLTDARERMVDSQLRPNKVVDPRILAAMRELPRERFLPEGRGALAYADDNIPLGGGRVMPRPMTLARLVQAAAPAPGEKILVAGAGTGYSSALLAALGCTVTALEEPGKLLDFARIALADMMPPIVLVSGPLRVGWPAGAPYDVILIEGAVPEVPAALAAQLNHESGRLVTIVGPGGTGVANAVARTTAIAVHAEPTPAGVSVRPLFDCLCPLLPSFIPAPVFEF